MLRIYAVVLLFSSTLLAKSIPPFRGLSYSCNVDQNKKEKRTSLKCDDISYELHESFLDNHLNRWIILESYSDKYITLFFTKGVHGEKAVIFSMSDKNLLKEITSAWPIEISKKDGRIRFHYKDGEDSQMLELD